MKQTQECLLRAFAGESQARNKYAMFAKMARKENLEWIARVFEETGDNERAHAEELYEQIEGEVKFAETISIVPYSKSTIENLKLAADGERHEWTSMYPDFEKIAIEENQTEATRLFGHLKLVEEKHEERYIILAKKLDSKTLYDMDAEIEWKCVNCGYIHKGKQPPKECPVCTKPYTWSMPLGLVR